MNTSGVFIAKKKDGTRYYRSSVTYNEKHISLGSFSSEEAAGASYALSKEILCGEKEYEPEEYEEKAIHDTVNEEPLSFEKWIMLLNLKKTGMYFKNPIYLYGKYFVYFLDRNTELKFDADEIFFFGSHKIQKRGGHLFYSDYGMQCSLLARYGVKRFAVEGRDYIFKNGDNRDFRFGNLFVINKYNGVSEKNDKGRKSFEVKIHVLGNVSAGTYSSEVEAAIAYNKAVDTLEKAIEKKNNLLKENMNSTYVDNNILSSEVSGGTNYTTIKNGEESMSDYERRMKHLEKDAVISRLLASSRSGKYSQTELKPIRKWVRNYIENLSKDEYLAIYKGIKLPKSFKRYLEKM